MPPPAKPEEKPAQSKAKRTAVLEDTLLFNAVKNYFKYAGVVLGVWGFGYFSFSPSWLLLGLVLFIWKEKNKTSQKLQIAISQEAARDERAAILARVEDLPSWVFFPDVERAEWLNKMIQQLWPYIGDYVKDLLHKSIEPAVKKSLPASLAASFRFSQIDLGDIPPRIGGIKVYTENVRRDEIYMDLEIIYSSDSEITVQAKGINAGIKDLQIHGTMRVIFKPLISRIPLFGGMSVFFLNNPTVDFNLTSLANAFDLPGLSDMLKGIVQEQIANIMVLPNRIPISMVKGLDLNKLRYPQPKGVLRINIIEAKDLIKADIGITGKGKSDPYVICTVGAQKFQTKVIDNTVKPVWNEDYEAIVDVADGQLLTLDVNDRDPGNDDDHLGGLSVDISHAKTQGTVDEWLPLEDVKKGMVHIKLTWLYLANDPLELDRKNGLPIRWTQLVKLVETDLGIVARKDENGGQFIEENGAVGGLRLLSRIRNDHLRLTPGSRMNVKLAAQVLSGSVAAAFKLKTGDSPHDENRSVRKFVKYMNRFFDCCNVSNKFEHTTKKNPYLAPYTDLEDKRFQVVQKMEEEKQTDEKFSSCILLVNLDSARELPRGKKSLNEPSPYCQISVGTEKKESWVKWNTNEPRWEQNFRFLIHNPHFQNMDVDVMDKKTGKSLGQCNIKLKELLGAMDMVLDRKFPLKNTTSNAYLNMRLTLRVLTTVANEEWLQEDTMIDEALASTQEGSSVDDQGKPGSSIDPAPPSTSGGPVPSVPSSKDEKIIPAVSTKEETTVRKRMNNTPADDGKGAHGLGKIQITLSYNSQRNKFIVVINKCINLLPMDSNNLSDPYVRLYLLPDKSSDSKRKTRVIKDNLNPVFDETLEYSVSSSDVKHKLLEVAIKNKNSLFSSSKKMMGIVTIDLANFDVYKALTDWYDLEPEDSQARVSLDTEI